MLKKMMAAGACTPKVRPFLSDMETRRSLIEPEFSQTNVKWDQHSNGGVGGGSGGKGVYTFISSPKAMHSNRKSTTHLTTTQYVFIFNIMSSYVFVH